MAKILIVDDEPRIRELIRENLQYSGYTCEEAGDGSAALSLLTGGGYDLVILDLMMPFMDGMSCLREMRTRRINTPVIILTARGEEYDKLAGLEGGADDYVVKPFQFEELDARLNALLRRSSGFTQPTIVAGALVLDINRKQAVLDGEPLALTAYEYRILEYLMRHHQQVVAKDRLMEQLYPDDEERDPNVIEVLVGRLRRKLEGANGFKPIDTVRGLGYLFTERCR